MLRQSVRHGTPCAQLAIVVMEARQVTRLASVEAGAWQRVPSGSESSPKHVSFSSRHLMRRPALLLLAALAACGPDVAAPPFADGGISASVTPSNDTSASTDVGSLGRGYANYCSKVSNTAWSFTYGTADPCASGFPSGAIRRAGMYSATGRNHVVTYCKPAYIRYDDGVGLTPLNNAKTLATIGQGRAHSGGCTFTVSPATIRYFDLPYGSTTTFPANYNGSGFDFHRPPYGNYGVLDHTGTLTSFIDNHDAHDFGMPRGTPLRAVADGVIIVAGMFRGTYTRCGRVGQPDCGHEGIVIVKHTIAASLPTYDEVVATGYFHVQQIPQSILSKCTPVDLSGPGQGTGGLCKSIPVQRGQVIAFAGARNTAQSHLHFATWRMTNTQAFGHKASDSVLFSPWPQQGAIITEPSGWRAATADPWATKALLPTPQFPNGGGTLSVRLWKVDPPFHWQP